MNELLKNKDARPEQSELARSSDYDAHYNPDRLFTIPREDKRKEIGINLDTLCVKEKMLGQCIAIYQKIYGSSCYS